MNEPVMNLEVDALTPAKGTFQERWDVLKRNRMAYASFWFLMFLLGLSIIGKTFTQVFVVFDPKVVRLSEKFLPPFTPFESNLTPKEDAPALGIYLLQEKNILGNILGLGLVQYPHMLYLMIITIKLISF